MMKWFDQGLNLICEKHLQKNIETCWSAGEGDSLMLKLVANMRGTNLLVA